MRTRLSLVLLAALLLSALATPQAMAACQAFCPNGDECTGIPVCCCFWADGDWVAYCGPIAGNPCYSSATNGAIQQDTSLQASYSAIFAPAPAAQPQPSEVTSTP